MKATAKMQFGFNVMASLMLPLRKSSVARVTPQPGQGIPYNSLEGQIVMCICPSSAQ